MATSYKRLKGCDKKTKNIVNGYIHEIQKAFPWQENSYYIIPELVNHICLSFYWIRFAFNKKYKGDYLEFIDESTVTKVNSGAESHSLCAIGKSISLQQCDLFRIEYTLKKAKQYFCPYIGFFMLNVIDDSDNIDWDEGPGCGINKENSVGIAIDSLYPKSLYLFRKDITEHRELSLKGDTIKVGDRYMLEFDFIKSRCYVCYNGRRIGYVIEFEGQCIIPCLSLCDVGETMKITKYEFIHNETQ